MIPWLQAPGSRLGTPVSSGAIPTYERPVEPNAHYIRPQHYVGAGGSVKALGYKQESRGFEARWG
jgi:hypothetical protein